MNEITIPCYVKEDDLIVKYIITIDSKKLQELRKEIIDNCSIIKHYESEKYMDDIVKLKRKARNSKHFEIRNYYEQSSGRYGRLNNSRDYKRIISVSYDEYVYPYLVSIIDGLMNGSEKKLYDLIEPNFNLEHPTVNEELKNIENKLKINNDDKELLANYKQLLIQQKLNSKQIPVKEYYYKVIDLLNIQFSSSRKFDDVKAHFQFVNSDIDHPNRNVLKFRNFTAKRHR